MGAVSHFESYSGLSSSGRQEGLCEPLCSSSTLVLPLSGTCDIQWLMVLPTAHSMQKKCSVASFGKLDCAHCSFLAVFLKDLILSFFDADQLRDLHFFL